MKVDWIKVWEEFNKWHDEKFNPTWIAQKRKIQQLVKKYMTLTSKAESRVL